MAMLAATAAGWVFGMLTVPVPSLMRLVASTSVAMNMAHEVMFSAASVDVLADVALHEAQLVGQDEGLAVLPQRLAPVLADADGSAW